MIKIMPAIDLYQGNVVRLTQGDFNRMTVYSVDPVSVAKEFYDMGARYLHVIDLEGAKTGRPSNLDVLNRIFSEVPMIIEYGGGLRSVIDIEDALNAGAETAILSTRALLDENFLKIISETYIDRIAVSIDVKGDYVYSKGWQEKAMALADALELISKYSIPHLIFTDIERDGTNFGVNYAFLDRILKASPAPVTIAGGVSSEEDVFELAKYETRGLEGIIIGRAYYEGLIDLRKVFAEIPQESEM